MLHDYWLLATLPSDIATSQAAERVIVLCRGEVCRRDFSSTCLVGRLPHARDWNLQLPSFGCPYIASL